MAGLTGYLALGTLAGSVFTEISGASAYARQSISLDPTGESGEVSNTLAVTFPVAAANDWPKFNAYGLFDSVSGGNMLMAWASPAVDQIRKGSRHSIPARAIEVTFDVPAARNGGDVVLSDNFVALTAPGPNVHRPVLGDQSAAAANVTRIQALLDAGGDCELVGSGIAWINAPLTIGSDTHLRVSPKLTLKMTPQASNLGKNLLQNKGYTRAFTTVTLTWSNTSGGLDCSVAWTGHGRSVGDLVVIKGTAGTTDSAFSGVFPVTAVTDANNIVVALRRLPTASPTGTIQAKLADRNISVRGGVWDYNNTDNSDTTQSTDRFATIISGASDVDLRGMTFLRAVKYQICVGAIRQFHVRDTKAIAHGSDIIKVYGPAYDGDVDGVYGENGDDCVSLQGQEPAAYAAYDVGGWGDVLDVAVRNVHVAKNTGSGRALTIYASPNQVIDGIIVERMRCFGTAQAVTLTVGSGLTGAIKSVVIRDVEMAHDYTQNAVLATSANLTVDYLELDGVRCPTQGLLNGNCLLQIDGGTYKRVKVRRGHFTRTTSGTPVYVNAGTINVLEVEDSYFYSTNLGSGACVQIQGGTIGEIIVRGNRVERFNDVVNVTSGAATGAVVLLLDNYLVNVNGGAVRMAKDGKVVVGGNVISGTMTSGLVLTNGATIDVFSKGGNVGVPAGGWLTRQGGTEVVNLYADDFEVDISILARVNNGRCINTNAALGTLGAAGRVTGQGTSSGSWHLLADPTKAY